MKSIDSTNRDYWKKKHHPISCGIELWPVCNMNCIHCYLQDFDKSKNLKTDEVKDIIDILHDEGLLFIYFTGGEILAYPDFIEVYTYAKKKGFIVELLTNITLLNNEHIKIFKELPPARVSVSIYGASEETYKKFTRSNGNFIRAMHGLDLLKQANIKFDIKFIALKENFQDFYKVKEIADSYNVQFSHSFEMMPTLTGNEEPLDHMIPADEIVKFESQYAPTKQRWTLSVDMPHYADSDRLFFCDIGEPFVIDSEGYMEPCNKLRTKEHKILEESFGSIWKDFEKYSRMVAPENYKCRRCSNRGVCVPCPAQNLLMTGSMYTPSERVCHLSDCRRREFSSAKYDYIREKWDGVH